MKQKLTTTNDIPAERLTFKIGEAASMLGISPSTLRKMVRRDDLNVITAFGPWLIRKEELNRLLGRTIR